MIELLNFKKLVCLNATVALNRILCVVNGVQEEFNLPMNSPIPGSEMTREPFRWDQRLFALVLRLAGW